MAEHAGTGDVVVTADVPLAGRCVKTGATVLAPNGRGFTADSIGMDLAVRGLMTDLRAANRSEARRVGQERVSPCRSRWSPHHYTKNESEQHLEAPICHIIHSYNTN